MVDQIAVKILIKRWLLQLAVLWILINGYDAVYLVYRSYIWGEPASHNQIISELLLRIWRHNFQELTNLYLISITLLAELNYQYIFKRYNWYVFIVSVVFTGMISVAAFTLFRNSQYEMNLLEPFLIIASYVLSYTLLGEFFYHRLHSLKVRANRFEAELRALKQQLHPHFLFNTLNYLYGTALQENATRTAEGIDIIAGMMRYTVNGMQERYTPLAAEIEFIEQYLHLQRLRMPAENATLILSNIQSPAPPLLIAPMLLMPFIENAFKYGISNDMQAPIKINIAMSNNELQLEVSNSIVVSNQKEVRGTGSGLNLTRKRLELLYPAKHCLNVSIGQCLFTVKLSLQLN